MGQTFSSLWKGLTYRGREGHYAFIVHRVAGLGILAFLVLHILDIFMMAFGEDRFNDFLALYTNPVSRVLEVALIFGVAYHAFNGLRIIIIDFWPRSTVVSRQMWWGVMAISLLITAVAGYYTVEPIFR